jgi:hypothetical protein
MSTTTEDQSRTAGFSSEEAPRRARYRRILNIALATAVLLFGGLVVVRGPAQVAHHTPPAVPRSSAMEKLTGVRFSRVVVVGDGGLVTAFYVVIDPEKATQFQADRDHPPHLAAEKRDGGTSRASIMRAGHLMRAGQTYYLVYQNTRGAIRSGETISIRYGGVTLRHVPVL